jgi:tol-pal system protein YbgF
MKLKATVGVVCIACLYGCATGGAELETRLLRMERQNSMLEKQLMASESRLQEQLDVNDQLMTSSAQLRATLDELRVNIQSLQGQIEEVNFSTQNSSRSVDDTKEEILGRINRIDEIARANKERIATVEQYLDFERTPSGSGETAAAVVPAGQTAKGYVFSDTELYTSGKQAFDGGQYEIARQKFIELLSRYPESENADNAQFWIGEIYYREKMYTNAILEYQKVIENYPDGNKVPASLLKQGLSFYNLGEQDDLTNARYFLQEVVNKYPASNEAKIARDKLQSF